MNFNFESLMQKQDQVFRQVKRRRTIRFAENNKIYFAKLFWGISLAELFKNLLQGRLPILDASHENRALQVLSSAGVCVPKVIDYKTIGLNPLRRKSFIVMEAIEPSISLEDYLKQWQEKPLKIRREIIQQVAILARKIHNLGVQHRDFYICHFLLKTPAVEMEYSHLEIAVIDWHRARFKKTLPDSWLIKDLAALYFSVLSTPLTRRDYFRFLKIYTQKPLKEILSDPLWKKVEKKAVRLYKKIFLTWPANYPKKKMKKTERQFFEA